MAMEYVNRRGERYYLLQGKTKTGKPKYYVSRKAGGVPVEHMPEGYEFYEEPDRGIVAVRKIRPTNITTQEREMLMRWTAEWGEIEYYRMLRGLQCNANWMTMQHKKPRARVGKLVVTTGWWSGVAKNALLDAPSSRTLHLLPPLPESPSN